MANHLLESSSPYLLQHAHNPVDWYPWGDEALARARSEDKPIFLSIGYAACHWCHVMEHECFENPDITALMNAHFINIKVDREERPDLDELYMLATQLMTGQGGWPMSVWLTPTLEPFYAGTYFPPTDGYGRPGFPRLLTALHDAWQNRREHLIGQAQKVVAAIGLHADESAQERPTEGLRSGAGNEPTEGETSSWVRLAVEQFSDRFDSVHGGLGGAPKFPPHQALQFWLTLLVDGAPRGISAADRRIIAGQAQCTLDAMKDGGIYDHVGGGFARYSTDAEWRVPHFEKMLYDSAQLAPVYAQASLLLERPDFARVAVETLDFFLREMRSPEGAFYSSLDADSEGAEGKYYVWTLEDIRAALPGPEDASLIIRRFNLTPEGNWPESPVSGGNILFVAPEAEDAQETDREESRISRLLLTLREFRTTRPRPGLDDKILTSWNGLMLSALAQCGRILREERLLGAAGQLAGFLLGHHQTPAGLQRLSRGGAPAHTPGFLDDHAFLLNGLLDLMQALPAQAETWRGAAETLAQRLVEDFQDPQHGGFFFTGRRHEQLFCRMKSAADNATPSANGVAIRALLRLGATTGQPHYTEAALKAVRAFRTVIARRPEYFPTILNALLEGDNVGRTSAGIRADIPSTAAGAPASIATPILQLASEEIRPVRAGATFQLRFRLTIAPPYHIQAAKDGTMPMTAHLRAVGAEVLASQEWRFPTPEPLTEGRGYAGVVEGAAICTVNPHAAPGTYRLRAVVSAPCCTQAACLPPEQAEVEQSLVVL